MGLTATQLGKEFTRSAAAMNLLLRDHGFIEGNPGAWRPTELGWKYAQAHDFDNGYGGYAFRQWGWLSWADGLIDALKASMEANPDGVVAPVLAPVVVANAATDPGAAAVGQALTKKGLVALAVLAVVAVSAPGAKHAWNERVRPAASRVGARIAHRRIVTRPPETESVDVD